MKLLTIFTLYLATLLANLEARSISIEIGSKRCMSNLINLGQSGLPGYNFFALVTAAHCVTDLEQYDYVKSVTIHSNLKTYAVIDSVHYSNQEVKNIGFELLKKGNHGEIEYCEKFFQDDIAILKLKGVFALTSFNKEDILSPLIFSANFSKDIIYKNTLITLDENNTFPSAVDSPLANSKGDSGLEVMSLQDKIMGLASCHIINSVGSVEQKTSYFSRWNSQLTEILNHL